jgi:pentatricopeptide repeat protein
MQTAGMPLKSGHLETLLHVWIYKLDMPITKVMERIVQPNVATKVYDASKDAGYLKGETKVALLEPLIDTITGSLSFAHLGNEGYQTLLQACMLKGSKQDMDRLYAELKNCGAMKSESLYPLLMRIHQMAGDPAGARRLMSEMKENNIPLGTVSAENFLLAMTRAGDFASAMEVTAEMRSCRIRLSHDSWNSFLHCAAQNKQPLAPFWNNMLDGMVPTLATVTILVKSCLVGSTDASDVLKKIFLVPRFRGRLKPRLDSNLRLDAIDWIELDSMFPKQKKSMRDIPAFGARLLETLLSNPAVTPYPSVIPFGVLVNHYSNMNQPSKALSILHLMRDRGLRPDSGIYGAIMRALIPLKDDKAVVDLLDMMKKDSVSRDKYLSSRLIESDLETSDFSRSIISIKELIETAETADEAINMHGKLKLSGRGYIDGHVISMLLSRIRHSAGSEVARNTFSRLFDISDAPPVLNSYVMSQILRLSIDLPDASPPIIGTLEQFLSYGQRPDFAVATAVFAALGASSEKPGPLIQSAIKLLEKYGYQTDHRLYVSAGEACSTKGDWSGVSWSLLQLDHLNSNVPEYLRERVLVLCLRLCSAAGDVKGAEEVVKHLVELNSSERVLVRSLNSLLKTKIHANDVHSVRHTLEEMKMMGLKLSNGMVALLIKSGMGDLVSDITGEENSKLVKPA